MISEGLIIALVVCVALTIFAYVMKSLPMIFISSIGLVICGLQLFQQTNEILPFLLLLMAALGRFFLMKKEAV